jgi:hypothetical protein
MHVLREDIREEVTLGHSYPGKMCEHIINHHEKLRENTRRCFHFHVQHVNEFIHLHEVCEHIHKRIINVMHVAFVDRHMLKQVI